MTHFTDVEWRYRFESSGLIEETFEVLSFEGSEKISSCFRFDIELISEDPNIPYEDVVNLRASLILRGPDGDASINGIVSELRQGSAFKTEGYYGYTAVLVPTLWHLTLSKHSRIFQDKSVSEIVDDILSDAKISDFKFSLKGTLQKREYCVQHDETDFDFINRLLEDEGIYYYFDFSNDHDTIIFTDNNQNHVSIEGDENLEYMEHKGLMAERSDYVRDFYVSERIITGKAILNDYNYLTPSVKLTVERESAADMPGQQYEFGDHYDTVSSGKAVAVIRAEEIECQRRRVEATSTCMYLRAGYLFSLSRHFRRDLNDQEYLVISVSHKGSQVSGPTFSTSEIAGAEEEQVLYSNSFSCIQAKTQFRPPRTTPVPRISGIMSGVIESSGGDYADIDDMGRYRARMKFDIGDAGTAKATRPIRMSQPHSGPDYGIHFPNHANTEMIWACINGDPDRPIALGTVPNPNNTSPSLAKNKAENIIRTKSGNQVVMDDTIDKAKILINTPDANRMVFDDNLDNIVIETTKKHKITLDDKNKRIEVKSTNGHFILIQDGENEKEGKITVQSEAGHRISINDKDELITLVDKSGDNLFQIDIGNKKLTISTKEGDIELLAEKGVIDLKAKTLNIETSADTNVTAKGKLICEAKGDHKMTANKITVDAKMDLGQKAGMNLKSEAGMNYESKAGMNMKATASMMNDVAGLKVSLKGSAMAEIAGGIVKIN